MNGYLVFVFGMACGIFLLLAARLVISVLDDYSYYRKFKHSKLRSLNFALSNI